MVLKVEEGAVPASTAPWRWHLVHVMLKVSLDGEGMVAHTDWRWSACRVSLPGRTWEVA